MWIEFYVAPPDIFQSHRASSSFQGQQERKKKLNMLQSFISLPKFHIIIDVTKIPTSWIEFMELSVIVKDVLRLRTHLRISLEINRKTMQNHLSKIPSRLRIETSFVCIYVRFCFLIKFTDRWTFYGSLRQFEYFFFSHKLAYVFYILFQWQINTKHISDSYLHIYHDCLLFKKLFQNDHISTNTNTNTANG